MTDLSSTAKQRLRQTHRESVLLGDVERHVMRESLKSDRDMSYIHPSDMAKFDFCARWAYYTVTGTPVTGTTANPSFQLQNIFAEGHAIHGKWQGWLQQMGVLWGRYQCSGCGTQQFSFGFHCEPCNLPATYAEVPLKSDEHMIRGHADGAVRCSDGKMRLIEIKSVGTGTLRVEAPRLWDKYSMGTLTLDGLWRGVSRPFPSHIRQGMIYLSLVRNDPDLVDVDEIVFIYEWKPTQAVKEFVIRYDDALVADRMEDARSVAASVGLGSPPERPHWAEGSGVSTCKKCQYRSTCWEINDDESGTSEKRVEVRRADGRKRRKVLGT